MAALIVCVFICMLGNQAFTIWRSRIYKEEAPNLRGNQFVPSNVFISRIILLSVGKGCWCRWNCSHCSELNWSAYLKIYSRIIFTRDKFVVILGNVHSNVSKSKVHMFIWYMGRGCEAKNLNVLQSITVLWLSLFESYLVLKLLPIFLCKFSICL